MKHITLIIIIFNVLVPFSCSCNKILNSIQWKKTSSINNNASDVRSKMVNDLIKKNILNGKNKLQIIDLLGDPEYFKDTSNNELYYQINEKYEYIGVDPIYIKYFIIIFNNEDKYENYKILEYKHK
jgi:outer membrane protein assembly factor BamE (lipoprotein component of BamABCDE complex)